MRTLADESMSAVCSRQTHYRDYSSDDLCADDVPRAGSLFTGRKTPAMRCGQQQQQQQ